MNLQNFSILLPELVLLAMSAVLLTVGLFVGRKQSSFSYYFTQLTLMITLLLTYLQHDLTRLTLHDMFLTNTATHLADMMVLICSIFCLAYSKSFFNDNPKITYDYCLLFLFSVLGMLCLIGSNHLLPIYLSLELLSLPLFALVAIQQTGTGAEAAMKYFAMGAFASALLLYGLSLIYGASGSLSLAAIQTHYSLMAVTGIIFVAAGLAFKLGATPFHSWVSDVYEGAPVSVVNLIASAPKIAVLIILIRLFGQTFINYSAHWHSLWIAISIASMALGNIAAIIQNNIRRMLAYSAIAHMGYMLLGFISGTAIGYSASLFYVFSYALMTLAALGALIVVSNQGFVVETLDDLRGLSSRNPWVAFMILIVMFSLAGIPPSIGFFAKMGVLQAIISVHLTWLAVLSLIFAIIGAYYYIRVVKVMYFEPIVDAAPLYTHWNGKVVLSINSLAILAFGIFPSGLINLCRHVSF
jgi:NADH-quinone oxidoreductase subunit N